MPQKQSNRTEERKQHSKRDKFMQVTADDAEVKDKDLVLPKTATSDEAAWLIVNRLAYTD